jgi:hypothetical protein
MDGNQRRLWDIESDIDEEQLSRVRFGRSRFLRGLSVGLMGLATGLLAEPPRRAYGQTTLSCGSLPRCTSCDDSTGRCTARNCTKSNSTCGTRGRTGNCWYTTVSNGNGTCDRYKCCDWFEHGVSHCQCSAYVETFAC